MNGLKIRVTPIYRAMVEALGGAAVTSPPAEVYTLMERNTVDGSAGRPGRHLRLQLGEGDEVPRRPAFYSAALHTLINLGVWNKLGAEQKIFHDAMAEAEREPGARSRRRRAKAPGGGRHQGDPAPAGRSEEMVDPAKKPAGRRWSR